jgi:hypothetical protein
MPPTSHQVRMAQLAELRAHLADAPDGEQQELRLVLGELDRTRALVEESMDRNTWLIEELSRTHHVDIHAFAGVFCRTCRAQVEGTRDGCAQHSPTRIVRTLLTQYAELHALFTVPLNGPDPEQDTLRRMRLTYERDRRTHLLLARACELLGPAMAPEQSAAPAPEGHRPGCAALDCRCGCPRAQNCQDCHRCVCWQAACCAEEVQPGADPQAAPPARCATCGDTGCRDQQAGPHAYCALCRSTHAQHHFVECLTFTAG